MPKGSQRWVADGGPAFGSQPGREPTPSSRRLGGRLACFIAAMTAASCTLPTSREELDPTPSRTSALWGESANKFRAVCGSGTYLHGVDVSKWQGTIDWPMVRADGIDYAFIRASYGQTGVDTTFDANWAGASSAGVLRGAYHYFNPAYSGVTQAMNMLAQFDDPLDLGELPIVVDVEESAGAPIPATYAARVKEFVDTIVAQTGRTPMIYTGGSFWDTYVASSTFSSAPVWVAHYFNDRTTSHCPNTPDAWPSWTFWQYSEMGTVAGITGGVDVDVFDGTYAELLAFGENHRHAKYVSQSFPLASQGVLAIAYGTCMDASITLQNIGNQAWTSTTELALSNPRDVTIAGVASPSWLTPSRLSAVTGTVAVGASFQFDFELCGNTLGTHDLRFNLVDGATWFSDPGQGGPSDTQLQALVNVVDASDGGIPDAGPSADAGTNAMDAGGGEPPVDAGPDGDVILPGDAGAGADAGLCVGPACTTRRSGACNVQPASPMREGVAPFIGLAAVLALGLRRSGRSPRLRRARVR